MSNNNKEQTNYHHYEDEANSATEIIYRIEKSQKELRKKNLQVY